MLTDRSLTVRAFPTAVLDAPARLLAQPLPDRAVIGDAPGASSPDPTNLGDRVVRLPERHGELIAHVPTAVLDDLGLGDRRTEIGPLVRRHMLELAS